MNYFGVHISRHGIHTIYIVAGLVQCSPEAHGGQTDIGTKVRSSRAEDVVGLPVLS